ncbi:MAG: hypothetical protein K8F34_05200 [Candidatus Kuenenia stuttgartiensis]|nr:hypothetical protein [Candidatus Kuenenia stuttgartiensis]GJQ48029.1 MAG: hypothetical protein HKUEN01_04150 [Candidatus Kuenenia stuttgartiensis]
MGKVFFTMLMDAQLHRELKLYAVENNITMKHLIERGILDVLNVEKKGNEFAGKREV